MKYFTLILILFFAIPAGAQTVYEAKTADNETASINDVQVEETITTTTVTKRILTKPQLEAEIIALQERVDGLTVEIVEKQTLLDAVMVEAAKVQLKTLP